MAERQDKQSTSAGNNKTPEGLKVTDVRGVDAAKLLAPGHETRQRMPGFDGEFVDIVDYIVRITHNIWEEHNLGLIYDHYLHNIVIHTSDGLTLERDKVIADSFKTLAAFPNLRLYADEVIWAQDAQGGFHTSHRITWSGRNTGHSVYGPPTNRNVLRLGIAHCYVKDNVIVEEWICRDELALVQQLGFNPHLLAKAVAEKNAGNEGKLLPATGEVIRRRGQLPPERLEDASADDPETFVATMLHNVWNCRLLGALGHYVAPHLYAYTPGFRTTYGLGAHHAFILSMLAAFPDLALTVDHQCHIGDAQAGYRVATRWFMNATHDGPGPFGPPSGKPICIWGVHHHEIREGKIEREWMLFDMFAILKQIYAPA